MDNLKNKPSLTCYALIWLRSRDEEDARQCPGHESVPVDPISGRMMPDQRSTSDQLRDVISWATSRGMYDAADFIQSRMRPTPVDPVREAAKIVRAAFKDGWLMTYGGIGALDALTAALEAK